MTITSIVSHGQGALETDQVGYCGAEEDTIGKARVYSEQEGELMLGINRRYVLYAESALTTWQ
jgi:hypothetical protein